MSDNQRLESMRQLWDEEAVTFDNEPDHGLREPRVREAWRSLLVQWLPQAPKKILDIGCGTGSLTLLLAELGHTLTGIDLSPAMIAQAKAKTLAAGYHIPFQVADAAFPLFPSHYFDVIVCRHLLWALPEPAQVLERWVALLAPGGRLILVEGFWNTGAGLHAQEIVDLLPSSLTNLVKHKLSDNSNLWGSAVTDERYALVMDLRADLATHST